MSVNVHADELLEPPTGLKTVTMTANVTSKIWNYTVDNQVEVGVVGNDLYILGLIGDFPDAWLHGTIDGTTVTFAGNQYIGTYGEDPYYYDMYAWGVNAANQLQDFIMTYDPATMTMTSVEGLTLNEMIYYEGSYLSLDVLSNISVTPSDNEEGQLVTVPDGVKFATYTLTAYNGNNGENVEYEARLGFDGDDVYLGSFGLIANAYDSYIKGYREGNTLVFPQEQYLGADVENGAYFYMYGVEYDDYINLFDLTLTYDAATDTYTAAKDMLISTSRITSSNISFIEWFQNMKLVGKGADGVKQISSAAQQDGEAYDLSGRRASKQHHGLLIKRAADGKIEKLMR